MVEHQPGHQASRTGRVAKAIWNIGRGVRADRAIPPGAEPHREPFGDFAPRSRRAAASLAAPGSK